IGDVDGDGSTETVFISPQKLHIYRFDQGGFIKIQEIPGQAQHRYVGVDVADIKNDGVSEIFVSCVNDRNRDVQSFVVEWDGKEFKKIVKNEPWYYRVINHPMFGKILVGQQRVATARSQGSFSGNWTPLDQRAFKLEWDAIKEAYVKRDKFKLPKGSNVFGLAIGDVQNNRTDLVVGFDNDDHLRIFNPAGKEDWTSEEEYGGSENFLEYEESSVSIDDPMKDKLFLPHRIFIADLNYRKGVISSVLLLEMFKITGPI
ncbi:MAG: VCBS repeat-containing protein, partial [Deltaproteobacteria bacterium]|nr:VCBS repeat-containing protein [Deltaproteobacteria bacterium]